MTQGEGRKRKAGSCSPSALSRDPSSSRSGQPSPGAPSPLASSPQATLPEFAEIFETYHGRVRALAAKLLGAGDADDVAQEVFIKVGRALDSLADPTKLAGWIYTITLNTVRDAVRRRAVRLDRPCSSAGSATPVGPEEPAIARVPDTQARSPEETVIRNEMVACYLDYVRQLPPSYFEVYVLSEFDELSNEEIARRLHVSLGAVKIRLHRARQRLYEELRRNCSCYVNTRGELMGEPKGAKGSN